MSKANIGLAQMGFPTRVVAGPGCLKQLPAELKALGVKRPLIVSDRGLESAGLVDRVEKVLSKAKLSGGVYLGVSKNPNEKDVLDGVEAYKELKADSVIALGGGAPMDVAKVIALKVDHHEPIAAYDDLLDGYKKVTETLPPIIAIATTAGTGSEVGRAGVIVCGKGSKAKKVVVFSPQLLPKVAMLDAELTVSLPAHIMAATGIDALTHALEAYVTPGVHPFADMFALGSLARVGAHLERAVSHPKELKARHEMLLASTMGAIAFQKGLGGCHALAHPLGAVANLHHGLANALMLPHIVNYNLATVPERYAVAGRALGSQSEGTIGAQAQACLRRIVELNVKVGLPNTLSSQGVKASQIPLMTKQAMADACAPQNPRELNAADVSALYKAAM